jgi:hypothetical protein
MSLVTHTYVTYAQELRMLYLAGVKARAEERKSLGRVQYRRIMDKLAAENRHLGCFHVHFANFPDFFYDPKLGAPVFEMLLEGDGFERNCKDSNSDGYVFAISLETDPPTYCRVKD